MELSRRWGHPGHTDERDRGLRYRRVLTIQLFNVPDTVTWQHQAHTLNFGVFLVPGSRTIITTAFMDFPWLTWVGECETRPLMRFQHCELRTVPNSPERDCQKPSNCTPFSPGQDLRCERQVCIQPRVKGLCRLHRPLITWMSCRRLGLCPGFLPHPANSYSQLWPAVGLHRARSRPYWRLS